MASYESPQIEVRCLHCDVSFPIGTKTCVHCGQRIGRSRLFVMGPTSADGEPGELVAVEPFDAEEEAEEVETSRSGRFMRLGVGALWLIAALLSALARRCQEG